MAPIAAKSIGRFREKVTSVRRRIRRQHRRNAADRVIGGHGAREHSSSIRKPPALASHAIIERGIPAPGTASAIAKGFVSIRRVSHPVFRRIIADDFPKSAQEATSTGIANLVSCLVYRDFVPREQHRRMAHT